MILDYAPTDEATVEDTARWILRQHVDARCPQCGAGGCWLVDWAREVTE